MNGLPVSTQKIADMVEESQGQGQGRAGHTSSEPAPATEKHPAPGSSSANHDAARKRRRGLGIVDSNACTGCRKERAKSKESLRSEIKQLNNKMQHQGDSAIEALDSRGSYLNAIRSEGAGETQRTMLYVSEHEATHKLTAPHLRAGIHPMNIFADVASRKTIPTAAGPIGRFEYHAVRLTAAAVTQTYKYVINGRLEYGLLTTGETIVSRRMDWRDPEALEMAERQRSNAMRARQWGSIWPSA
ncbi:hypothetical protein JX266_014354 [Neoarthrinium moseri]|nr:hypothetical protein JX266_014354 [Neoarthrinium moseri]